MLQLLVRHGVAEQRRELGVAGPRAQRGLQVPLSPGEEAGAELAVRGQADSVTARAEGLGDRVDETDLTVSVGEAEALGGGRRLRGELDERSVLGFDQRADLAAGEHLV